MLAESLQEMRQQVVRQLEARIAAAPSLPGVRSSLTEDGLRDWLPLALDDLSASLRRGRVEPEQPSSSERAVEPQHGGQRSRQGPDPGAAAADYGLLADCIFDLIEQDALVASPGEMRTLSAWLSSRASAAALAKAAQLQEQNRRLTALLDAVPDPMSLISCAGRLLYLNRAGLEVARAASGVPAEELIGKDWHVGYPADFACQYEAHLAAAKAGSTVTAETLFPTPNGARWFQHKLSPVHCGGGTLVALAAVSRDIHDLKESESRFRVALAHSNISVFEKDSELRLRWMYNPMFGKQPADVIGKTDADFFSPEEAGQLASLQRDALRTGERIRQEVSLSPRGERRYLLVDIEPLRDASGAVVGLTGAATDITAQKRAQEDLARALAFREQVMGILGHDLRNPLSAVRVLAALLLRREDLPEAVRSSLWEIDRSGRRMLEMIGTLLDFTESRVKETLPITPVPTDMHEVCRGVVEEQVAANPGRGIELELEGDGRGRWDPARLAQVVSNLVGNALKHGAKHGPVRVSVSGDDEEMVLEVTNEGPVISPDLMQVLFEPFRRGSISRDASNSRGLGLGLYIVQQIVNAHGGAIAVESTCERGTTFTVRLPRAAGGPMTDARRMQWDGSATAGA